MELKVCRSSKIKRPNGGEIINTVNRNLCFNNYLFVTLIKNVIINKIIPLVQNIMTNHVQYVRSLSFLLTPTGL